MKERNQSYKLLEDSKPLREKRAQFFEQLERSSRIVLLGDPGCGKSTVLKYITIQVCKYHFSNRFLPFYVPIFLKVSEYAKVLKSDSKKNLLDFIYGEYDRQYAQLFSWAFENRQALLILDGLDEVIDTPQRIKVVDEVQDIVCRMPENRYIITSRIIGYNEARFGKGFSHFTLKPFNKEQIRLFCESWYKAVERGVALEKQDPNKEATKLYNAIVSKPEIENLASNPLMVTLIANIHFKGQSLPSDRVQVYDIATETLLQYWVQSRVESETQLINKDDVIDVLSPVAFYIHENSPEGLIMECDFDKLCNSIFASEEYSLSRRQIKDEIRGIKKFLRQQAGFFHEKGIDENSQKRYFGFLHQTFQEYLAGIEIVNRWKEGSINFTQALTNPRWTESMILAAGILRSEKGRSGRRSVTKFVEDILQYELNGSSFKHPQILLVSLILIDNIDFNPNVQQAFFNSFFESWEHVEDSKIENEYVKRLLLFLRSKHKDHLMQKINEVIKLEKHGLHKKLPPVFIQNFGIINDAKKQYIKFLTSKNLSVAKKFWDSYHSYVANVDQNAYWDCNQTGGYPCYNHHDDLESFISISEFYELIDKIPEVLFFEIFSNLKSMAMSYQYVYSQIYGPNWYLYGLTTAELVTEIRRPQSQRICCIFLSMLADSKDILEYKDEIEPVIKKIDDSDYSKFSKEIMMKISDLEKKKRK